MSDFARSLVEAAGRGALKPFTQGIVALNVILACAAVRFCWPECPPSGYAVVALTGALCGIIEVEMGGRLILGQRGLLFDLSDRGWRTAIAVFGLVYLFAIGLFAYEWHGQRVSDAEAAQRQVEQDQYNAQIQALKGIVIPPRPDPKAVRSPP